jgi:hypothetical protein
MGVSRKQTIDKVIHFGHRAFLPEDHIMRYFGMSNNCCPVGYYEGTEDSVADVNKLFNDFKLSDVVTGPAAQPHATQRWTHMTNTDAEPEITDERPDMTDHPLACDGNCSKVRPSESMLNTGYSWDHFKNYCFFAHCNFCRVRKYSRHPESYYTENGTKYDREFSRLTTYFKGKVSGELTGLDKIKIRDKVRKLLKDFPVKGTSPYFMLKYRKNRGGIRDSVCFEPFHCLMNISEKLIVMLKGEKIKIDKHEKLALCENRFPFLVNSQKHKVTTTTNPKTVIKKKKVSHQKRKRNQYSDIPNNQLIPFALVKREQEMVDWRLNCIVLPFGHKTSNSFRFLFRQTGYLKGNDKIKWLTTYLKFTLIFSDLVVEYKNFLSLLSDLIADVLSPVVTDAFIADLFMRTVEALCLWEGMFIDSEQYFSVHELLDIVDSLAQFGPARGWWALAGERFMAKVKNFCPKGGANCLKVLFDRFVLYENACKFKFVFDKKYFDNLGRYSDNMIKFTGGGSLISRNYWNDWVKNRFYTYVYQYVNTLEHDAVYHVSPFMRLYETYIRLSSAPETFLEWIQEIVDNDFDDSITSIEYHGDVTPELIDACIHEGVILINDVATIEDLYTFCPVSHDSGFIKGVYLRGRGVEYSEIGPARRMRKWNATTDLTLPSNPLNNLLDYWDDSDQYSSMVKYNNWSISASTKKNTPSVEYGQANYFFRMKLPSDPFLNNVGFASITGRFHQNFTDGATSIPYVKVKITTIGEIPKPPPPLDQVPSGEIDPKFILTGVRNRNKEPIDKNAKVPVPFVVVNNFKSDCIFVAVNFMFSTAVGVCGMTLDRTPILLPVNVKGLSGEELEDAEKFCCKDPKKIVDLFLIDLDPSRKHVETNKVDSTLTETILGDNL